MSLFPDSSQMSFYIYRTIYDTSVLETFQIFITFMNHILNVMNIWNVTSVCPSGQGQNFRGAILA